MKWAILFTVLLGSANGLIITLKNKRNLITPDATSGYIVSPGYVHGSSYPRNFYGMVTLTADIGFSYIRLDFEDVDLDVASGCSGDDVQISDVYATDRNLVLCSTHRPNPWLSSGDTVTITFSTDKIQGGRGFKIRYAAVNSTSVCDSEDHFECRTRDCIRRELVCNGRFDCRDGSDEESCQNIDLGSNTKQFFTDVPCGTPTVHPLTLEGDRVVGGQQAVPHSWPWQASLQSSGYDVLGHFCGGALISNTWLLTAAHCVIGNPLGTFTVKLASHSTMNTDGIVRHVKSIIIHPRYFRISNNNDIALVELAVPVNFSEKVRPACLPAAKEAVSLNTTCFSTGWGHTRGSGDFANLKQTKVKTMAHAACKDPLLPGSDLIDESLYVCAGDEYERAGVCNGDSGGPLVCEASDGRWILHGVTSMNSVTTGTSAICASGVLWTSVQAQLQWILDTIQGN